MLGIFKIQAPLRLRRAKMLADVAADEAKQKDLGELNAEIAQKQADWQRLRAKSDAVAEQCEDTLAGLNEKLSLTRVRLMSFTTSRPRC